MKVAAAETAKKARKEEGKHPPAAVDMVGLLGWQPGAFEKIVQNEAKASAIKQRVATVLALFMAKLRSGLRADSKTKAHAEVALLAHDGALACSLFFSSFIAGTQAKSKSTIEVTEVTDMDRMFPCVDVLIDRVTRYFPGSTPLTESQLDGALADGQWPASIRSLVQINIANDRPMRIIISRGRLEWKFNFSFYKVGFARNAPGSAAVPLYDAGNSNKRAKRN